MIMLLHGLYQEFIDNIQSILKPDGHTILKIMSSDNWPFKSDTEIINWYRTNHMANSTMNSRYTHLGLQRMGLEAMSIT